MAYHINLEGEVGSCSAKLSCPFGDFETQHFTTKEQAHAAYEAAMMGETVKTFTTRESYFKALQEKKEEETEEAKKYREYLQALEPVKTKIPPLPAKGHVPVVNVYEDLKEGDVLPDGRIVSRIRRTYQAKETGYGLEITLEARGDQVVASEILEVARDGDLSDNHAPAYREGYDSEELAAFDNAVAEAVIEDSAHNFMSPRNALVRSWGTTQAEMDYVAIVRLFKARLKQFEKSELAYPHTRAYLAAVKDAKGSRESKELFAAVMQQDENRLPAFIPTKHLVKFFPKGKKPFQDLDLQKLRQDRAGLGLFPQHELS